MSKEHSNSLLYLFSKTWMYSEDGRKRIVLFWALFILAQFTGLFVQPFVWAKMMEIMQKHGVTRESFRTLLVLLGLTLICTLVFWSLHGPARVLERANAFRARMNYRKHLMKGVMTLPIEWHTDHHSGDTIDKVEKGTSGLYSFSKDSFETIYSVVQLVCSYAILIYLSRSAAIIVLTLILISVWITMRFEKVLIEQYHELNRTENQISESVYDAISNITTVIILRVEKLVFSAIMAKVEKPYGLYLRSSRISEVKWFLTNLCSTVMKILVLGFYFWQNIGSSRGVLVGEVYLLINYLEKIGEQFFHFTNMYGDIVIRQTRVMNSEVLTKDFRAENFTNHVLPTSWKRLEIRDLNFSYHSQEEGSLHLEDVHFSFARGERIALVGESGSGKTTLLKVMRDLYHPRNLNLQVDGRVIREGFEGISRAIALVPQNPEIFATTIMENITLGAEYPIEFVEHFTDMACFSDVVQSLPRKFDSSIKEKGVNLSGGQQQRLALSRGLLACHDKDIVLLDEPTSSLDTSNEMRIYQNIFRDFQDKTIISSIHRLHLLPLFDTIYLFERGHIVASGNLRHLLSTSTQFQQMWHNYSDQSKEDEVLPV